MNILFLTLLDFDSIQERSIYTDLLREFVKAGHKVYAISPVERKKRQPTHIIRNADATILKLKIGNTQKTNILEKGISTVLIEPIFIKAIKKYFSRIKFDLVLYSTPPITFVGAIEYVKKRDNARSYLLLKDIFPQNAVDMGLMTDSGLKSIIYKHFRRQEKKLYAVSDTIGCMSKANLEYILENNKELAPEKVEICPNSIDVVDKSVNAETRRKIREKYGIPQDKTVFVYGGNIGKPQGVPFLVECLEGCKDVDAAFFLIVGDGTEFPVLENYALKSGQNNLKVMRRLPKQDYDTMIGACDVGMIFLDHRFSIPNYPSRILSYMQAKLPVLAVTDTNTDIGKLITEDKFGWWCESDNSESVSQIISNVILNIESLENMGANGYQSLLRNFTASKAYQIITRAHN